MSPLAATSSTRCSCVLELSCAGLDGRDTGDMSGFAIPHGGAGGVGIRLIFRLLAGFLRHYTHVPWLGAIIVAVIVVLLVRVAARRARRRRRGNGGGRRQGR